MFREYSSLVIILEISLIVAIALVSFFIVFDPVVIFVLGLGFGISVFGSSRQRLNPGRRDAEILCPIRLLHVRQCCTQVPSEQRALISRSRDTRVRSHHPSQFSDRDLNSYRECRSEVLQKW